MPSDHTIQDHLQALGEAPAWVVSLGEAVKHATGCSTALAAARARDLSLHPKTGKGLEMFTRGWIALQEADLSRLSPLQQETLRLVVEGLIRKIEARMRNQIAHA